MTFDAFTESGLIAAVGWSLLHSIWQIALVTIGSFFVLRLFREGSANLRYAIAVAALVISITAPVLTFIQVSTRAHSERLTRVTNSGGDLRSRSEATTGTEASPSLNAETGTVTYAETAVDAVTGVRAWIDRKVPDVLPIAVLGWLAGVAFFSIRLGGGFWQLQKYRLNSFEVSTDTFEHLRTVIGVARTVRLRASELVHTPVAIGILKPVILIPTSLFLQISPRELELIIAHELIHIRRLDPIVNVFQCVVEAMFFYHPGIWWISAQIRSEREFATDAAVTDIFRESHTTYARALANLEEIRLRANQERPRYATAANGGNFTMRIQRILKIKTEARRASSAWTACLTLLLASAFLLATFSATSSEVVNAHNPPTDRKLAIGFVSIPPLDRTTNPPKDSDATARLLIQKLKEYKVPATGFLMGGMISDGEKLYPVRANIARLWIESGLEVGIGGFKHIKFYDTPVDEYIANIEKNELIAKRLLGENGSTPRYFSYPLLNVGKTVEDRAKVESWLAARGYTPVKYTVDNQEWMYSYAYDMARNDNDVNTMKEVREAYLGYMQKMFDHYEAYSAQMFGRDISQTMVLTPSRLITDTADEFFGMLMKRGYTFVTIDEAQKDPAYKTAEDYAGAGGISWFERWQMAKKLPLLNEPNVDGNVWKTWNDRHPATKK